MSLAKPIGRQKEVLCLPAQGHFAVLGTAGSGKTTLAILRSAYLAEPTTDHHGKTLLVTFNRALVTYLRHLKDRRLDDVSIENYHTFARGYLAVRNQMSRNHRNQILSDPDRREALIEQSVNRISRRYKSHPLLDHSIDLFSAELGWMAQHGITTYEAYKEVERVGRADARIDRGHRELVFEIYQMYRSLRESEGYKYDWDDISTAVCREFDNDNSPRLYRHIVIDEGQDFSPEMIRSLAKAIPPNGSLTFFGDVAQQIYGHRMSWRSAGLNIDKVWEFKENYRNTKQIAKLGLAISQMPYFKGVPDLVEPISPPADGPLPTVVKCSSMEEEIKFIILQAVRLARSQSVAILFRDRQDEKLIKPHLPKESIRLHREMTTWQAGPGIRYGTYHSAKGLEFDTVMLPFCNNKRLPHPEAVAAFGQKDATIQDGRLLYVGVTRAKIRLIVTYSGEITCLLPTDSILYESLSR
ncbi:3'-5' exonuclease [Argonema antarcticum]|uniref:3'-5' exonuclease n=1 Tax=Argonema antarcticum TaxID=2942763 RepID=UPI0020113F83|nr:3'-5' exonuclease [Argonema antarcticum]MCL1469647.1 AAA family ATPase [Argonema antarcticum A004/B2]